MVENPDLSHSIFIDFGQVIELCLLSYSQTVEEIGCTTSQSSGTGEVQLTVVIDNHQMPTSHRFTFLPNPTITSVTPQRGFVR